MFYICIQLNLDFNFLFFHDEYNEKFTFLVLFKNVAYIFIKLLFVYKAEDFYQMYENRNSSKKSS